MTPINMTLQRVVSRNEWLAARKELLTKEKELTRHRDKVNADRRRLPTVRIDKEYVFASPAGKASLRDLFEGDFNYDFHVTLDEALGPVEYNYRDKTELVENGEAYFTQGESHGLSVFLRDGDRIFHTYSTYARGVDLLIGVYNYLDLSPLGRQEDWEEPPGRSDSPFLGWVRYHDRYGDETEGLESCCGSAA